MTAKKKPLTWYIGQRPRVSFEYLTFSDGTTIQLGPRDITVFVGPNNAGKSAALRELEILVGTAHGQNVIRAASLKKVGRATDIRKFLARHGRLVGSPGNQTYQGYRYHIPQGWLDHGTGWEQLQSFKSAFCSRLATETRITDSNPQSAIAVLDQTPQHPIHMLFVDDELALKMSNYFQRAFGKELILFRGGGSSWPLMVGKSPPLFDGEDRISSKYLQRLKDDAAQLSEQGDGMRSFASVILHVLAPSTPSVLLLDEPEAFLHPPQARLLGEFLANERPRHAQLFVATHSQEILQGMLSAAPDHMRVVRIQRDGSINRVKELDKARAKAISNDPLMKFSGVMSGVFHQRVIICESDADCMFYSTMLDAQQEKGSRQPDVLFVQAAGKHRMAALAEALRALDVDVDVIADIDILNDDAVLKRLVTALGGEWNSIQPHQAALRTSIEQHKPWLNAAEVTKGIQTILAASPGVGEFPKPLREQINSVFKKASPWDAVKDGGEAAIPAGQPTQHWEKLNSLCSRIGLWIVPVGELEGFCKAIGGHGPRWVQSVFDAKDPAADPSLERARGFVKNVWARLPS